MAKPLFILSKCSLALMRKVAMELVRISVFKPIPLLFSSRSLSVSLLSSYWLNCVPINDLSLELDKFSGDDDEFGEMMRELFDRTLIACELVLRFCGDEIGAIRGNDCDCAAIRDDGS